MPARFAFWGAGEFKELAGGNNRVDWDGDIISGHIGVDANFMDYGLLAGVLVSTSYGSFDYTAMTMPGTYSTRMTSVHPYLAWSVWDKTVDLWVSGGYGQGELEIEIGTDPTVPGGSASGTSDTEMITAAMGLKGRLLSGSGFMGGESALSLKGDVSTTQVTVEGNEALRQTNTTLVPIGGQTVDAHRVRLLLEGSYSSRLGAGQLTPAAEIGMRYDAGSADTGVGVEVGTSLGYVGPIMTLEGRVRGLLAHSDGYEEWGVLFLVRIDPGADGRGLSLSLRPVYGQADSQIGRFNNGSQFADSLSSPSGARDLSGRLETEIGYGLAEYGGMLTPYGGLTLSARSQRMRLGSRFELGPLNLHLEAERQQGVSSETDHSIILRAELNF